MLEVIKFDPHENCQLNRVFHEGRKEWKFIDEGKDIDAPSLKIIGNSADLWKCVDF